MPVRISAHRAGFMLLVPSMRVGEENGGAVSGPGIIVTPSPSPSQAGTSLSKWTTLAPKMTMPRVSGSNGSCARRLITLS